MHIRLIISAVVLCALPLAGWAQDTSPPPPDNNNKAELAKYADKKVTLSFEGVSMTTALRALMKTVEADFVIDPALDKSTVNTKLTNLRFPIALAILLKSGTIPADFTVTNGVFRFVPRKEVPQPDDPPKPEKEPEGFLPYIVRHPLRNADAERLAAFLNGNPFYSEPPPNVATGSVSGHGDYSTSGFDNGTLTMSGGSFNQNFGNGSNNNSGSGYNWSGMLNQFLGGMLGGGRRRR